MNPKQKLYHKNLVNHLMKGGIEKSEAQQAATMAVHTLIKQGAGFQMGHARKMAEWMLIQKQKVDKGNLRKQKDGSVIDEETGEVYHT